MKVKQLVIAMALTGLALPSVAREPATVEENRGLLSGLVIGAAVGGPIGAGFGAIIGGGIIGKTIGTIREDRRVKNEKIDELQAIVDNQSKEKKLLEQSIAALSQDLDRVLAVQTTDAQRPDVPIQFRTGSSDIEVHYQSQLDKIAVVLARNPDTTITLSGFADRRGDSKSNQVLSQKRVSNVRSYLIKRGVRQGQVDAVAFGESRPLQSDESLENNFFDRRVVMELSFDIHSNLATR